MRSIEIQMIKPIGGFVLIKNMNKTLQIILVILLIGVSLVSAGCTESEKDPGRYDDLGAAGNGNIEKSGKIVTDELGREVTIPADPTRVLALTSAAMQALLNVGVTPVGKVEDYKTSELGMALPSVGTSSNINVESVCALKPDLIIASSRFHAIYKEEFERSGMVVYYFDPDKVGDIPLVELTPYLAKLVGKEVEAEQYVRSVYDTANELKVKVADTGIKTGIMIQDGDTINAAQSASGLGSMFTLLGIENIVPANMPNAKKASFVPFDAETIIKKNPDLIFIVTQSKDPESNKAVIERFKKDPQWSGLSAVKNNKVLILPFSVNPNRSTPEAMVKATAEAILKSSSK